MPGIHRQGDSTTGHGCWPPANPTSWSTNVFVNSKGVVRNGDTRAPHTCPSIPETHGATYTGTSTVYVNGKAIQKCGSSLSCGDSAATCSSDVFAD